jgi:Ca2+-binding RTX toxin-like protein
MTRLQPIVSAFANDPGRIAPAVDGSNSADIISGSPNGDVINALGGNDTVYGQGGNDTIDGGTGNDALDGGVGDDSLMGGDGSDIYYVDSSTDVVVETNANAATGGTDLVISTAGAFTLGANLENLRIAATGTANATGNALNNTIYAGAGDNLIDGGAGSDTVSYACATSGVDVAADDFYHQTGGSGTDLLTNVEHLVGSAFDDHLVGNQFANFLRGGDGNDTLNGANGFSGADDIFDGGAGIDTVSFSLDFEVNASLATGTTTTGATLTSIENLVGASFGDTLTGDAGANVLDGSLGADTLYGGDGVDTLLGGEGNDSLVGGLGADSLVGGSGNDTYVLGAGDTVVELANGGIDLIVTVTANTVLADNLENLQLADNIAANGTGNAAANTIFAGYGDNVMDGAAGIDTVSYARSGIAVDVWLALNSAQATGGSGNDTLVSIENLVGTAYGDRLRGNGLANRLEGGNGNDTLSGGAGNDTLIGGGIDDDVLDGGDGNDLLQGSGRGSVASYATAAAGVTVNLQFGTAQDTGGAGIDTVQGFNHLQGSAYADVLTGNDSNNILTGGNGSDIVRGGGGSDTLLGGNGNDSLDGGAWGGDRLDGGVGTDVANFTGGPTGLVVDLALGTSTSDEGGNVLIDIENVLGSANADVLRGNSLANVLDGVAGNDTLGGGDGNDTLRGGVGDDVIDGGAGNDRIEGGDGPDTASFATAGAAVTVSLALTTQATGGGGNDTLLYVENLVGSAFADTLRGNSLANRLDGGGAADTLSGGGGADTFVFGTETDSAPGAMDNITDFSSAQGDRIDLSRIDANPLLFGDQAFTFIGSAGFIDGNAAGQLRYAGGIVYGSIDADADAEFAIAVTGAPALAASDFLL